MMNNFMRGVFLALLFLGITCPFYGQNPAYQNVIFASSAPSGACTGGSPAQIVIASGVVYTCQTGTWAAVVGSGTFAALTGDATSTATGGSTVVQGIKGVAFCTGFTPTNTQALTLTTASAPNPCWTAATPSGGVSSFTGDGSLLSNSASTGAVTATLATATAHKYWGNNTGSTAAPGYVSIAAGDLPAVPLSGLATQIANTLVGNGTGSTAVPTALAVPSCSTASSALTWTSGTGFGCNSIASYTLPTASTTVLGGVKVDGTTITIASGVISATTSGTGTVTSFSAGTLSPLFTTSVGTPTSTPALTFTLSNAAQNSVFAGPAAGGAAAPSFQTAPTFSAANLTSFPTFNQNTTGNAATVTTAASTTASSFSILAAASTSGSQSPATVAGFTINPSTGAVAMPGSITSTPAAGTPGSLTLPGDTTPATLTANNMTLMGPNTATFTNYGLQYPSTGPAAAGVVLVGAPSTNVSQLTFGLVPLTDVATQATNTILMNATGGSASPTAVAMPTSGTNGCAGASDALSYNTTTHALGCTTIAGGGGGTGTTGQNAYFSGTNTVVGTDTTKLLSATGLQTNATIGQGNPYFSATWAAIATSTCTSVTTSSCTITNGALLNPNGGVVLMGYGSNNVSEVACYTAATSTTITFGQYDPNICSASGRGSAGSTAQNIPAGAGGNIELWVAYQATNNTTAPVWWLGQDGDLVYPASNNAVGPTWITGRQVQFATAPISSTGYFLGAGTSTAVIKAANTTGAAITDGAGNIDWVGNNNSPSYNVATQTINGSTSLTAITAAVTPTMALNQFAASASQHGQLRSDCVIFWQQATAAGGVGFGVTMSAAPTSLTVFEKDYAGASGAMSDTQNTVITTTTTTATSPTITPAAIATTYTSELTLILNPGVTNSVSVTLYGKTLNTSDALNIQPQSGCTPWH